MRGGIRGRIPLVRRTHILDDEMTPHSIDRGLAGSSKQRRRDDFDLKGRSREHLVGAGITVWYQEASARNSSVHELVTTRTQISLQCSFKHAWCVYSPPPPPSLARFRNMGGERWTCLTWARSAPWTLVRDSTSILLALEATSRLCSLRMKTTGSGVTTTRVSQGRTSNSSQLGRGQRVKVEV